MSNAAVLASAMAFAVVLQFLLGIGFELGGRASASGESRGENMKRTDAMHVFAMTLLSLAGPVAIAASAFGPLHIGRFELLPATTLACMGYGQCVLCIIPLVAYIVAVAGWQGGSRPTAAKALVRLP